MHYNKINTMARGHKGDRPPKDAKTIEKALKPYKAQTHSVAAICELCGLAQGTLYKATREKLEQESHNLEGGKSQ